MSDRDQGSFIGGLTVGLFAGAVGYFLFGTDKGRQLKKHLAKEWEQARANMPDRGEGLTNFSSLRDVLLHIKQQIDETVNEAEAKADRQPKRKAASKKPTKF